MSHNLNIVNGRASMMYVGEPPWHGLGVRLPKLATSAEAIEAAGLDYHVDKKPMFTRGGGKRRVEVPDHFCTVRQDTGDVLGVVDLGILFWTIRMRLLSSIALLDQERPSSRPPGHLERARPCGC